MGMEWAQNYIVPTTDVLEPIESCDMPLEVIESLNWYWNILHARIDLAKEVSGHEVDTTISGTRAETIAGATTTVWEILQKFLISDTDQADMFTYLRSILPQLDEDSRYLAENIYTALKLDDFQPGLLYNQISGLERRWIHIPELYKKLAHPTPRNSRF